MIFGESGGGAKTSCLYAMPGTRNYFNKASIESGPGIRMLEKKTATETTRMVLRHLGLEEREWRNLLSVPVEKLVEAQVAIASPPSLPGSRLGWSRGISGLLGPGAFAPTVDGRILPNHPFDPAAPAVSKDKPLIVGTNRDETTFFFWERKATDVFELTFPTLKERLQKELGSERGRSVEDVSGITARRVAIGHLYCDYDSRNVLESAPLRLRKGKLRSEERRSTPIFSCMNQTI